MLGGGSAGFAAAIKAAELGASVTMVNAGVLGGTCVNVGCVPSKTLIRAAEANHRRQHHGFAGVPATDGAVDWRAIRAQKDSLVTDLRTAKYWSVLQSYGGIELFQKRGRVGRDGTVTLEDTQVLQAGKVIVTTGSSPRVPPIPGLSDTRFLDSTTAMDLPKLPESMLVIGAGFVAMELGQMFARLGTKVTIMSRRSAVLRQEDPDIGKALLEYARQEGMEILTDVKIQRVEQDANYTVHYEQAGKTTTVAAEQLLVATGRKPNTADMGLEEAGVQLGSGGNIVTDDRLQTANPLIYAAGDVLGEPMFVYVAAYAGAVAAGNALANDSRPYDLTAVPRVTFTDPAAATVGLTEAEAKSQGYQPITSILPLEHVPRAIAARDTRGFVKLVADAKSRRIVGAHILAPEAGEMITEPAIAIRFGLTIEDITATFHPYLTLSEGIKLAAQTFDKDVAQLSCCAA